MSAEKRPGHFSMAQFALFRPDPLHRGMMTARGTTVLGTSCCFRGPWGPPLGRGVQSPPRVSMAIPMSAWGDASLEEPVVSGVSRNRGAVNAQRKRPQPDSDAFTPHEILEGTVLRRMCPPFGSVPPR